MMRPFKRSRLAIGVALVIAMAASTLAIGSIGGAGGAGLGARVRRRAPSRVASMGIAAQFVPGVPNGVQARIKEFNDNNEIKGVKIDWKEFADDKEDVSLALSEARRLVTQVAVFAIVGDVSTQNPAIPQAAEGAVLRLGVRRHVLQHGTSRTRALRLRLQRLPRSE